MRVHPVRQVAQVKDWSKAEVVMHPHPEDGYQLTVDGMLVATCESAKNLGEWALWVKNAPSVRFPFDLKILEPTR